MSFQDSPSSSKVKLKTTPPATCRTGNWSPVRLTTKPRLVGGVLPPCPYPQATVKGPPIPCNKEKHPLWFTAQSEQKQFSENGAHTSASPYPEKGISGFKETTCSLAERLASCGNKRKKEFPTSSVHQSSEQWRGKCSQRLSASRLRWLDDPRLRLPGTSIWFQFDCPGASFAAHLDLWSQENALTAGVWTSL